MSRQRFVLTPQARAYRDQTKPLEIIAIVHGARHLEAFFERRIGGQAAEAAE